MRRRTTKWAVALAMLAWPAVARPQARPDPEFLKREQATPLAPRPKVSGIEHLVVHYDRGAYCGHPREVLFQHFGRGEIILGHYHAPCRYEAYDDVRHVSYQSRSVLLLQRSTDGGRTWAKEGEQILFDQTAPADRKRAFLFPEGAAREKLDMFRPDSVFHFARTSLSADPAEVPICFALRSPDKGRTWEKAPTIVANPLGKAMWIHRHNTPVVRRPDGRTLLAAFQMAEPPKGTSPEADPAVFASTDQGLTWHLVGRPVADRSGQGFFAYATLLLLPSGDLHCYALHIARGDERMEGLKNALCVSVSRDGGRTWSEPAPIVGKGGDCWKNPRGEGSLYRSPYPLLLRDGRILVLFARRRMPAGIGGVLSADAGRTWSGEFVIRDDGAWWDLGYPVGFQLDDGRVFTAYYFPMQDGNKLGGTRHIAATFFSLE